MLTLSFKLFFNHASIYTSLIATTGRCIKLPIFLVSVRTCYCLTSYCRSEEIQNQRNGFYLI
jgi:hypothetical protein